MVVPVRSLEVGMRMGMMMMPPARVGMRVVVGVVRMVGGLVMAGPAGPLARHGPDPRARPRGTGAGGQEDEGESETEADRVAEQPAAQPRVSHGLPRFF